MPADVCVALISDDTDAERDGGASVNGEGTCQNGACERTLVGGRESRTSFTQGSLVTTHMAGMSMPPKSRNCQSVLS